MKLLTERTTLDALLTSVGGAIWVAEGFPETALTALVSASIEDLRALVWLGKSLLAWLTSVLTSVWIFSNWAFRTVSKPLVALIKFSRLVRARSGLAAAATGERNQRSQGDTDHPCAPPRGPVMSLNRADAHGYQNQPTTKRMTIYDQENDRSSPQWVMTPRKRPQRARTGRLLVLDQGGSGSLSGTTGVFDRQRACVLYRRRERSRAAARCIETSTFSAREPAWGTRPSCRSAPFRS